ncbi:PFL_4703 family integrating conjugative element protein [Shewanella bicestrii]|jgi:integrating conjugative element protein (TIGR03746 family)
MSNVIKSRALSASDKKDKIIRALTIFSIILLGLVGYAMNLLATLPKEFECHFPPDLSRGGMVKVNEWQSHEIYAFAYRIWQKVKRCEEDCSIEYPKNINNYGYYFTDSYRPTITSQSLEEAVNNRKRARSITEYGNFIEDKVVYLGNEKWVVYLDVKEQEHIGGKKVRDAVVRYPIIVSVFDVDREKNPWRLGIDGLQGEPKRLD